MQRSKVSRTIQCENGSRDIIDSLGSERPLVFIQRMGKTQTFPNQQHESFGSGPQTRELIQTKRKAFHGFDTRGFKGAHLSLPASSECLLEPLLEVESLLTTKTEANDQEGHEFRFLEMLGARLSSYTTPPSHPPPPQRRFGSSLVDIRHRC